ASPSRLPWSARCPSLLLLVAQGRPDWPGSAPGVVEALESVVHLLRARPDGAHVLEFRDARVRVVARGHLPDLGRLDYVARALFGHLGGDREAHAGVLSAREPALNPVVSGLPVLLGVEAGLVLLRPRQRHRPGRPGYPREPVVAPLPAREERPPDQVPHRRALLDPALAARRPPVPELALRVILVCHHFSFSRSSMLMIAPCSIRPSRKRLTSRSDRSWTSPRSARTISCFTVNAPST